MKRVIGVLLLLVMVLSGCARQVQGSYPSELAWNDYSYVVSAQEVPVDELGDQLGTVKAQRKPVPIKNGDANFIPVGSKLFEIIGVNTKAAVAVECGSRFFRAVKASELR
ncbi:MAG: hypothetical protein Q8930_04970 [Bacillota bacterium]|nr:hypothetical protein [Bacillota bacterium]